MLQLDPFKQLCCYQPRLDEVYQLLWQRGTSNQHNQIEKNVQTSPICTVSNSRVEIFRGQHGDSCQTSLPTLHTITVLIWPSKTSTYVLFLFFPRRVSQALSHVLLFLTFFSSSCSLAPSRVKMMPVWELRPTADTSIRPDPSITWVPGGKIKKKTTSHN